MTIVIFGKLIAFVWLVVVVCCLNITVYTP